VPQFASLIILSGLILFDMRHADDATPRLDVVLLQRHTTSPSDYYDGAIVPKHKAYIRFRADDDNGSSEPDMTARVKGVKFNYYVLDGDSITLDSRPADKLVVEGRNNATCGQKYPFDLLHLSNEVCAGCGPLSTDIGHLPSFAATFAISNGCIGTTADGRDHSWCLEPAGSVEVCRPVPQAVRVDLATVDQLDFTLTRGTTVRRVKVKSKNATDHATTVYFEVASVDDIPDPRGAHEFADHHFEVYYDLFACGSDIPEAPRIPYQYSNNNSIADNLLLVDGANCPPTTWP